MTDVSLRWMTHAKLGTSIRFRELLTIPRQFHRMLAYPKSDTTLVKSILRQHPTESPSHPAQSALRQTSFHPILCCWCATLPHACTKARDILRAGDISKRLGTLNTFPRGEGNHRSIAQRHL